MDTKIAGRKGGLKTAEKGPKYFKKIQKLSVEARRKKILESFTVEYLDNPITEASVADALSNLDKEEGN